MPVISLFLLSYHWSAAVEIELGSPLLAVDQSSMSGCRFCVVADNHCTYNIKTNERRNMYGKSE